METMYARRRFQGLSLEQQRKSKKSKKEKFKRRKSNATTASRHSTIPSSVQLDSSRSRVRKENPFQLQVRNYSCKYTKKNFFFKNYYYILQIKY